MKTFLQKQLSQGLSPQDLALTLALGVTISVFPIIGSTTALCLLVGIGLKLNQPVLQSVNYALYPLQIILVPVFLKLGAELTGTTPVSINPKAIVQEFSADTGLFLKNYGLAGLHGILVWMIVAPFLIGIIYFILHRIFKQWRSS